MRPPLGMFLQCQFGGQTESDDQVHGQRTGAKPKLLTAAMYERSQWREHSLFAPRNQGTNSLWTMNLVTADANQLDAWMAECIDGSREPLGGIDMHEDIGPRQPLGYLRHRLQDARLIVGMHQRDQQRVVTDRVQNRIGRHMSLRIGRHESDFESLSAEYGERLEYRFVFDARTDDMSLADLKTMRSQSEDRQIVTFRRTAGEDDFVPTGLDNPSDLFACQVDGLLGLLAKFMRTPRIPIQRSQDLEHRDPYARIGGVRRVAVQVERHDKGEETKGGWTKSCSRIRAVRFRAASV